MALRAHPHQHMIVIAAAEAPEGGVSPGLAQAAEPAGGAATQDLGEMPEWNLADLYASPDAPEVEQDITRARQMAESFKASYQGKIAAHGRDGPKLAEIIAAYEAVAELMSRLGTYAGLYYAGDQADQARAKFYGDTIAKLTEISRELIFVELEFNQIENNDLAQALGDEKLKHYKPWLDDLRKEKPFQLDEKLEQLFTDKSQTAAGAWNRLFSDTMAALRFDVEGELMTLEPTLNLLMDKDEARRKAAAEALSKTFQDNIRIFTLVINTLAKDKEISDRWRGFKAVSYTHLRAHET